MTTTPLYDATRVAYDVDPANLPDYSADAITARATDADRERGARIVARLGEGGEG